jgi:hypothetical protein
MNWVRAIHNDEEEETDRFFVEGEDEEMLVTHYLLHEEASGSHWRREPNAPPKWPNKRDHATGDAQI